MKKYFYFNFKPVDFSAVAFSLMVAMLLCFPAVFSSCKNDLIEPPDFGDRGAYISTSISTPEGVSATQGGYRSITVSWKPVANAVKYEIYTSKSATGIFEKTTETNGNDKVSVSLGEDPDVLTYYRIKAYDKNGNVSAFSKIFYGSTLAAPIITNVIQDESGKSARVKWFAGEHCANETYKSEIMYTVLLYADSEGATPLSEKEIDDASTECEFTGLTPKTTYWYQVKAYLRDTQGKEEVSAIVDRETARRLIPSPVAELNATQGTSAEKVDVSFILPNFVDVKESGEIFAQKPLYFEISRAEVEYIASDEVDKETGRAIYKEGELLSDYTVIATIKSNAISDGASSGSQEDKENAYFFDCTTSKTSSAKLAVEKVQTEGSESSGDEATTYMPGYKLTFTDDTAVRSMTKTPVYSYKITSYADTEKRVTSDESVAKTLGWLIDVLKLSVEDQDYQTDETKQKITKISVAFSGSLKDNGKEYTYIVTQNAVDFRGGAILFDGKTEQIVKNGVTNKLEKLLVEYDFLNAQPKEGYYSYSFYIAPAGTTEIANDNYYVCYKAPTKITVGSDVNKLPTIKSFAVKDGYSDKFVVEWDYNKNYSYRLNWIPIVDGKEQKQESLDIVAQGDGNTDDSVGVIDSIADAPDSEGNIIATFNHQAVSGDVREYSMTVTSGYGVDIGGQTVSYTLGTADARQVGYDYDKITIEWEAVQKADSYALKAYYAGDESTVLIQEDAINAEVDNKNTLKYIFNLTEKNVEDYKNAQKAGKEIRFDVTAKNSGTKSETTKKGVSTYLVGPANVDAKINAGANETLSVAADYITLSWKKVPGAKGYLINRVMYKDTDAKTLDTGTSITYYYDASSESNAKVTLPDMEGAEPGIGKNTKGVDVERVVVTGGAVSKDEYRYELYDRYAEPGEATGWGVDKYREHQAKIPFGLPFKYVVIPVLNEDDFKFEKGAVNAEDSKIPYTNIPSQIGATIGFGTMVAAEKAINEKYQKIEWVKPYYNKQGNGENGFRPVLYKRGYGRTTNEWTRVRNLQKSDTELYVEPISTEKYSAVEYAVKYVANSGNVTEVMPVSYMDYLNATKENRYDADYKNRGITDDEDKEALNKGYLFTTGFSAQYGGTLSADGYKNDDKLYSELVTIDSWNFEEKTLGPVSYTLEILNLDLGSDWKHVIDLNGELDKENTIDKDSTKIKVSNNEIYLMPMDLQNGTASGLLKVLRSGKHYYRLKMERGLDGVEPIIIGGDKSVSAYRSITIDEFTKAAIIGMSTGMYKERGTRSCDKDGDNIDGLTSTSKYNGRSDHTITFVYEEYIATHTTKSGENAYAVKISGNLYARGGLSGGYQNQYFSKDNNKMKITYENFTGTMYFNGTDDFWTWNQGSYPVNRTKGTIDVTYNGQSKTYDMSKSVENSWTLPFAVKGGYSNDSEEWQ